MRFGSRRGTDDAGAADGTRAGFVNINTSDFPARPLYVVESLAFHEGVPGHHLQIMLTHENETLSDFRRRLGITVFTEGWGLYAERLGREVGFFKDPYSDFGRLTYEIWRAVRLVVDSGVHALGWTRAQAIAYMAENTGFKLGPSTAEVDRHITEAGQGLAYTFGMLKILDLRARAEVAPRRAFRPQSLPRRRPQERSAAARSTRTRSRGVDSGSMKPKDKDRAEVLHGTNLKDFQQKAILYGFGTVAGGIAWLIWRDDVPFQVAVPLLGAMAVEAWKNIRRWAEWREAHPRDGRMHPDRLAEIQQETVQIMSDAVKARAWFTRGIIVCVAVPSLLELFVGLDRAVAVASVEPRAILGGRAVAAARRHVPARQLLPLRRQHGRAPRVRIDSRVQDVAAAPPAGLSVVAASAGASRAWSCRRRCPPSARQAASSASSPICFCFRGARP